MMVFVNLLVLVLVFLAVTLCVTLIKKNRAKYSSVLLLISCVYMVFIRGSVLLDEAFMDTEMVIGFWFLFCAALYLLNLENKGEVK